MKKRGLKRVISFTLFFALVLSMCMAAVPGEVRAADGDVVFTVTADKQTLHRGDTVMVTINMSGNTEAYGLEYNLTYDTDRLEFIEPADETAEENMYGDVMLNTSRGDQVAIGERAGTIGVVVGRRNNPMTNGSVAFLPFKVLDNAQAGNISFAHSINMADGAVPQPNAVLSRYTDNTNLSVVIPATGITLNKTTADIINGRTEQLTATLEPEGSNSVITWKSSDESVASVDGNGLVTAKKTGKATITATAEGKSASCMVNVIIPLNGISIEGDKTTIKKGQTAQLNVIYDPENTTENKKVTWSSSNESFATVDANGLVTAKSDGDVVITARVGTKTATYTIKVQEIKLTSISIKSTTTIHRGENEKLEVTYNPADTTDDTRIQWTSSDETVAKVDASGKVEAVAVGGAKITAKVGQLTAECNVTVDAPLKSIIPAKSSMEMIKNQKATVVYTLSPTDTTDSRNVTVTSSAPDVVEVNPTTNELTAKKAGIARITLTGANSVKAEITVTVTEIPINKVSLDRINATVEKGDWIELTALLGPDNTTDDNKTITWTSSDDEIISISPKTAETGEKVTVTAGQKGGMATITATAWNGTKATCEIFVPIHIESITLPSEATVNRNTSTNPVTKILDITYVPSNTTDNKAVTWESDNPAVAKVNPKTGVIEGIKEGEANITATTTETTVPHSATTKVTVVEHHMVEAIGNDIEFEDTEEPVLKGQSINMYTQLNLARIIAENQITDDITIVWTSSNPEVATVDQSGAVWGVKEGRTTIKAVITATDGSGNQIGEYMVETEMEIKEIPLESIAFNKIIKEMQVGETDILSIIYNPDNTTDIRDVVWSSSDASVLSVENGKLSALKIGTAEITAKVGEKSVTCTITVKAGYSSNKNKPNNGTKKGSEINTGDAANVGLYIMLMVVSIVIVTILYLKRGRQGHCYRRRR